MFGFNNEDMTDITVVLDRSGSMQAVYEETVAGFQAFVEKQKKLPGNCRLTLIQFDTIYETVYRNRPIHKVRPLKLRPRGGTALLDAMGRAINDTAARTERDSQRPARSIVVVITDGHENSSREFTRPQVFSAVQHYQEHKDWQFVFLGANQDAIHEARKLGIDEGAAMTYHAGARGTLNAWNAVGAAVGRHRECKAKRVAGTYFTSRERDDAAEQD